MYIEDMSSTQTTENIHHEAILANLANARQNVTICLEHLKGAQRIENAELARTWTTNLADWNSQVACLESVLGYVAESR
jgi:hypothetical protein